MDLLKGIAIVIDNGIGGEDNVNAIIEKIRNNGIPTSEFKKLDDAEKCVHNFLSINFIVLDWKMEETPAAVVPSDDSAIGVTPGSVMVADTQKKVIDFIKKVKGYCFAPIFIFTNEDQTFIETEILKQLRDAGLYHGQEGRDFIYVRNKNDVLKDDKLFKEIQDWIHKTPSVYLLKVWDKEFLAAKNAIFWDLFNKSKGSWPKVLWEHYEKENESPGIVLNETIFQLISNKVSLDGLEKDKVCKLTTEPDLNEVKEICKGVMFQDGTLSGVKPGDIFKDGNEYTMNIRPECDTVKGRAGADILYLLVGKNMSESDIKKIEKQYSKSGLSAKVHECFVWLLDGNNIVGFDFRDVKLMEYSGIKDKRICRLLPPYITNIQQRFSSYLGRFGIPRLPEAIEKDLLKVAQAAPETSPENPK